MTSRQCSPCWRWEIGNSQCILKPIQPWTCSFYDLLQNPSRNTNMLFIFDQAQNTACFGPDRDWNHGGWGEGRNKAIIPLDLMLNQWHFKGNQGGSCQAVFMSCSEKEAPRWRSLCWKQRYEHFSISLLLLFWVSFRPVFSSAPHLFSTANAVCRSLSACQQQARAPGRHPEPQSVLDPLLWAVSDSTVSSSPSCPQGSRAKAFPFYG